MIETKDCFNSPFFYFCFSLINKEILRATQFCMTLIILLLQILLTHNRLCCLYSLYHHFFNLIL